MVGARDALRRGLRRSGSGSTRRDPRSRGLWARVSGPLSDDPLDHVAAFTYASDLTLLGAALVPHGINLGSPDLQPASLDHTIWFHRPFRADEWWLYDQWSPTAVGGRGLALARVFAQDGRLVATVAQEGLIRVRRDVLSAAPNRARIYHYIDVVRDRHAETWLRL